MRHQPCLCLCLGFSQITLILPFLLMILHFSQIGFTDDLTFTVILLSFVVRLPSVPGTHQAKNMLKTALRLQYLYKIVRKMGAIQASQQSSLEHYNTKTLTNQEFFALFISPDDSSLGQIVGGHFKRHLIARENPDVVHAELATDGC